VTFFFFQAEDGIRDWSVTGVQTCALPILGFVRAVGGLDWRPSEKWVLTGEYYFNGFGAHSAAEIVPKLRDPRLVRGEVFGTGRQIGRASCREREERSVGAGSVKRRHMTEW